MGTITNNNNLSSGLPFSEVVAGYFKANTPESTKVLFWKVFQCWALKDCNLKAEVSDEEVALTITLIWKTWNSRSAGVNLLPLSLISSIPVLIRVQAQDNARISYPSGNTPGNTAAFFSFLPQ